MVASARQRPHGARVVTITSGKGGVGKSSFTLNFAIALSRRGYRVLIIDADFGLANIDVMSAVNPKHDLSSVLRRQKRLRDIITPGPDGVGIISGGSGVGELLRMNEYQLERIMSELLQLDDVADIILFDTGAGISPNILRLVRSSNEVILVTTPEPTAIMDAYALLKTVSTMEYGCRIRLIVNKADTDQEAKTTLQNLERASSAYLGMTIESLGSIPNDPAVVKAVKEQVPFMVNHPTGAAAHGMDAVVRRFLELPEQPEHHGVRRFFDFFFSKRGK
jgi:flagellar biosynthesis protein FlhG